MKYAFHYTVVGADELIIRFDNHHGTHELHLGSETDAYDFPGLAAIKAAWVAALPTDKREDWR